MKQGNIIWYTSVLNHIFMSSPLVNFYIMFDRESFSATGIFTKVLNFAMSLSMCLQIVFCFAFRSTYFTCKVWIDFFVIVFVILPFSIIIKVFATVLTISLFSFPIKEFVCLFISTKFVKKKLTEKWKSG